MEIDRLWKEEAELTRWGVVSMDFDALDRVDPGAGADANGIGATPERRAGRLWARGLIYAGPTAEVCDVAGPSSEVASPS
ncbi:MAG: hypothetical protein ABI134_26930, partial [Byssovorax sp.]